MQESESVYAFFLSGLARRPVFSLLITKNSQYKSMPTKRYDNQKAYATVNLVNEQLSQLNIDIVESKNISDKHLGRHGLHLTNHGRGRLAMNFISYVKKL